jgi:hypothetical protein
MTNEIADILKKIQYSTDLTIGEIAKKIGYSREHLTKAKKSAKGEEGILNALKVQFSDIISQSVSRETPAPMAILSHEAIMKLIDSNKILAEANADIAAAHKQLAADQHAIMLKLNLISQPAQDPEVEILLHSVAELLLKVGVSAKAWETVNAGQKELSKLMSGKIPERKVVYKKQGTGS